MGESNIAGGLADCDADFGTKGRNPSQWLVWGFSLIENLSKGLGHVCSRDGRNGRSIHKLPIKWRGISWERSLER